MQAYTETQNTVTRNAGITGKLVVGGTVSTGLVLGGYTVGALALSGRINGNALLLTSLGLFMAGAFAGLVISTLIGVLGREDGQTVAEAFRGVAKGILYAVPASLVTSVLAGWIALAVIGLYAGKTLAVGGSILAAVIGLGILAATFKTTVNAGANAVRRLQHAF